MPPKFVFATSTPFYKSTPNIAVYMRVLVLVLMRAKGSGTKGMPKKPAGGTTHRASTNSLADPQTGWVIFGMTHEDACRGQQP